MEAHPQMKEPEFAGVCGDATAQEVESTIADTALPTVNEPTPTGTKINHERVAEVIAEVRAASHPFANDYPLTPAGVLTMVASYERDGQGQLHPIIKLRSGLTVYGRTRQAACILTGRTPVYGIPLDLADDAPELKSLIVADNITRRQVGRGERLAHAARTHNYRADTYGAAHPKRTTLQQTADELGVILSDLSAMISLLDKAPDLFGLVADELIYLTAAELYAKEMAPAYWTEFAADVRKRYAVISGWDESEEYRKNFDKQRSNESDGTYSGLKNIGGASYIRKTVVEREAAELIERERKKAALAAETDAAAGAVDKGALPANKAPKKLKATVKKPKKAPKAPKPAKVIKATPPVSERPPFSFSTAAIALRTAADAEGAPVAVILDALAAEDAERRAFVREHLDWSDRVLAKHTCARGDYAVQKYRDEIKREDAWAEKGITFAQGTEASEFSDWLNQEMRNHSDIEDADAKLAKAFATAKQARADVAVDRAKAEEMLARIKGTPAEVLVEVPEWFATAVVPMMPCADWQAHVESLVSVGDPENLQAMQAVVVAAIDRAYVARTGK